MSEIIGFKNCGHELQYEDYKEFAGEVSLYNETLFLRVYDSAILKLSLMQELLYLITRPKGFGKFFSYPLIRNEYVPLVCLISEFKGSLHYCK